MFWTKGIAYIYSLIDYIPKIRFVSLFRTKGIVCMY